MISYDAKITFVGPQKPKVLCFSCEIIKFYVVEIQCVVKNELHEF